MADLRTLAEYRAAFSLLDWSDPVQTYLCDVDPHPSAVCVRCQPVDQRAEVDRLREELERCTDVMCRQAGDIVVLRGAVVRLQGELAEMTERWRTERARRTMGGAPLRINEVEWQNEALGTPEPGAAGAV